MLTSLAVGIVVFAAVQAAMVALVSAARPAGNVYLTIIVVSIATAPLALVYGTHHLGQPLGPDGMLYVVLIHLALGGFLFHFMTLPDRSVTLRVLVEVLLAPGHVLSAAGLARRYGVQTMITSRLEQLSAGRFIELSHDGR